MNEFNLGSQVKMLTQIPFTQRDTIGLFIGKEGIYIYIYDTNYWKVKNKIIS